MSKLIISGKKQYTKRMYKHLRKEHPSTKHRMILRDRIGNVTITHPSHIDYCEQCGKKMKRAKFNVRECNLCKSCLDDMKNTGNQL